MEKICTKHLCQDTISKIFSDQLKKLKTEKKIMNYKIIN